MEKGGKKEKESTVVPGFSVLGFSVLPGFRALKAGDRAWSVHKTLFGFSSFPALYLENKELPKSLLLWEFGCFFTAKKLTFDWFEFQSPFKASGLHK